MGEAVDADSATPYTDLKGGVGSASAGPNLAREMQSSQVLPGGIPHHSTANGSAKDTMQLHEQLG